MADNFFTPWADNVTTFSAAVMNSPLEELDRAITFNRPKIVSCDGDITWDSATGTLAWSGTLRFIFNREDGVSVINTVASGSVVLADNQFARVTLSEFNETALTVSVSTASPGSASNFLAPDVLVLAYRNAASDALVCIGLPAIPQLPSGDDTRISNLETEVTTARGTEDSLGERLDAIDLAIGGAGTGSVTSVGLSLPAELTVTNSPVTTTGTLTGAWAVQAANEVFAGPTTGADAQPGFRTLVAADLPSRAIGWPMYVYDKMVDDMLIFGIIPAFAMSIPADLAGTTVRLTANPTASVTVTLKKNGTDFGTVAIATNGAVTLTSASGASFNGTTDELTAHGPTTADATLTNLGVMLKGWTI